MGHWGVSIVAFLYVTGLFLIAFIGDRYAGHFFFKRFRPHIYSFALAVYCTSWTYLGSVGYASQSGLAFLAIYIGPALAFIFGINLFKKIIHIGKQQNITSIADFISARYGKKTAVSSIVVIISMIAIVPYIALQLKAVVSLISIYVNFDSTTSLIYSDKALIRNTNIEFYLALIVTFSMAIFAILFGTRHADSSEHQSGLTFAIAVESLIKIIALTIVGLFVVISILGGFGAFFNDVSVGGAYESLSKIGTPLSTFLAILLLSTFAIFLLPRQFHMSVVEYHNERDIKYARWLFPIYLLITNLFILPIALAGMKTLDSGFDSDMFVLLLPLHADNSFISLIAFIGGISAAVAMVIVSAVALSIMLTNGFIFPALVEGLQQRQNEDGQHDRLVLNIRRIAILIVMILSFAFYEAFGDNAALASIGLMSFAAIAQLAPSFFFGLLTTKVNSRGALAGMSIGILIWAYTLLLPLIYQSAQLPAGILHLGPFSLNALNVPTIFGYSVDHLTYAVFWSLTINTLFLFIFSLLTQKSRFEYLQARLFVYGGSQNANIEMISSIPIQYDRLLNTVSRYIGKERAERSFTNFASERGIIQKSNHDVDPKTLQFAENLLASSVGAASARLILSLVKEREAAETAAARNLLSDASVAIQYNREILQAAINHVEPGICVFDEDNLLVCWNYSFRKMLSLPESLRYVGTPIADILTYIINENIIETDDDISFKNKLLSVNQAFKNYGNISQYYLVKSERFIHLSSKAMPSSGFVITLTDITERRNFETNLELANERLEQRVQQRTAELEKLNHDLEIARKQSDAANANKTHFLAAASHDILQPLNAARLYSSALFERVDQIKADKKIQEFTEHIEKSLFAVEDILSTLLDISRLDSGAMKPELNISSLNEIFEQLKVEFTPLAQEKNLKLIFVETSLSIQTDPRLFRRILQNLISNAIKYTQSGKILIGCRRLGNFKARIEVYDTGIGFSQKEHSRIFQEFQRLDEGVRSAAGLGLGLSIVDRISRVLQHQISVSSNPGHGSQFAIQVERAHPILKNKINIKSKAPSSLKRLSGLRVLSIDNDYEIRNGMKLLLEGWGCDSICVTSLQELYEEIRKQPKWLPQIALLDYHLDEGTGIEALIQLRWKFGRRLPAAIITADRSPELKSEIKKTQAHFLPKPLKPAQLKALLSSIDRSEE